MKNTLNQWGYEIIDFIPLKEKDVEFNEKYQPLSSSMVLITYNNKYLIVYNKYRKQWELPAGGKEKGESLRACANRELKEETNQVARELIFKGLFKVRDKRKSIDKYQGFFTGTLDKIEDFIINEETDKIKFVQAIEKVVNFDSVDQEMINIINQREI